MESLGFVECDGLSGALVAADRMLKTANVQLKGIHETMGIGWVTIKITGDISAVSAATNVIKETMPKVYISSTVLGSPAKGTKSLGQTNLGIFEQPSDTTGPSSAPSSQDDVAPNSTAQSSDQPVAEQPASESLSQRPTTDNNGAEQQATCNLCGDPKCPRKLGEPHKKCIHYDELKKK